MVKILRFIILLFCLLPNLSYANIWGKVSACITDPCSCGCRNVGETWNGVSKSYKHYCNCPPYRKPNGRSGCLKKFPLPGQNAVNYLSFCAEDPGDNNYFNPKVRVRMQACNISACWTESMKLSYDGQCTQWATPYGIPLLRLCARIAIPASSSLTGQSDDGYTTNKHLNTEGATVDDAQITISDGVTTTLQFVDRPKLCVYQDPWVLDDPLDLMDINPLYQPFHTGSGLSPIAQIMIAIADMGMSIQNLIPQIMKQIGVPESMTNLLSKITKTVGQDVVISTIKVVGQLNRNVSANLGCIDIPMGPFPPPYCNPMRSISTSVTIDPICPTVTSDTGLCSTSSSTCMIQPDDVNKCVFPSDSSFINNVVNNVVRVGFDNFVPLCSSTITDSCVTLIGVDTASSAHAMNDIVAACGTSPCATTNPVKPVPAGNSGFRILYAIQYSDGTVYPPNAYYTTGVPDCPVVDSAGRCQGIWGVNVGAFRDITLTFPPTEYTFNTTTLASDNVSMVDLSGITRSFKAAITRTQNPDISDRMAASLGITDQNPNNICIFETTYSPSVLRGCVPRATPPIPTVSTGIGDNFNPTLNVSLRVGNSSTNGTITVPTVPLHNTSTVPTVLNLGGFQYTSFVTDNYNNVAPFSTVNSQTPVAPLFGAYSPNSGSLIGVYLPGPNGETNLTVDYTPASNAPQYLYGLEYINANEGGYYNAYRVANIISGPLPQVAQICLSGAVQTASCPENPQNCVLAELELSNTVDCASFSNKSALYPGLSLCDSNKTICSPLSSSASCASGSICPTIVNGSSCPTGSCTYIDSVAALGGGANVKIYSCPGASSADPTTYCYFYPTMINNICQVSTDPSKRIVPSRLNSRDDVVDCVNLFPTKSNIYSGLSKCQPSQTLCSTTSQPSTPLCTASPSSSCPRIVNGSSCPVGACTYVDNITNKANLPSSTGATNVNIYSCPGVSGSPATYCYYYPTMDDICHGLALSPNEYYNYSISNANSNALSQAISTASQLSVDTLACEYYLSTNGILPFPYSDITKCTTSCPSGKIVEYFVSSNPRQTLSICDITPAGASSNSYCYTPSDTSSTCQVSNALTLACTSPGCSAYTQNLRGSATIANSLLTPGSSVACESFLRGVNYNYSGITACTSDQITSCKSIEQFSSTTPSTSVTVYQCDSSYCYNQTLGDASCMLGCTGAVEQPMSMTCAAFLSEADSKYSQVQSCSTSICPPLATLQLTYPTAASCTVNPSTCSLVETLRDGTLTVAVNNCSASYKVLDASGNILSTVPVAGFYCYNQPDSNCTLNLSSVTRNNGAISNPNTAITPPQSVCPVLPSAALSSSGASGCNQTNSYFNPAVCGIRNKTDIERGLCAPVPALPNCSAIDSPGTNDGFATWGASQPVKPGTLVTGTCITGYSQAVNTTTGAAIPPQRYCLVNPDAATAASSVSWGPLINNSACVRTPTCPKVLPGPGNNYTTVAGTNTDGSTSAGASATITCPSGLTSTVACVRGTGANANTASFASYSNCATLQCPAIPDPRQWTPSDSDGNASWPASAFTNGATSVLGECKFGYQRVSPSVPPGRACNYTYDANGNVTGAAWGTTIYNACVPKTCPALAADPAVSSNANASWPASTPTASKSSTNVITIIPNTGDANSGWVLGSCTSTVNDTRGCNSSSTAGRRPIMDPRRQCIIDSSGNVAWGDVPATGGNYWSTCCNSCGNAARFYCPDDSNARKAASPQIPCYKNTSGVLQTCP